MCLRLGKQVVPPPQVQRSLRRMFGAAAADIAKVQIVERSLFARLHGRAVATTRRRRIFLRGSAAEFFCDPVLMLHEYCHVLLQWERGSLTTLRYVRECLRHGYWNNRFEIEARDFADRNQFRFRELLEGGTFSPCWGRGEGYLTSSPAQPSSDSRR